MSFNFYNRKIIGLIIIIRKFVAQMTFKENAGATVVIISY